MFLRKTVGNATYRMLISQSIDSYLAATNTFQKALVVRKAAAGILSIGGRFLKKSRNKDGVSVLLDDDQTCLNA